MIRVLVPCEQRFCIGSTKANLKGSRQEYKAVQGDKGTILMFEQAQEALRKHLGDPLAQLKVQAEILHPDPALAALGHKVQVGMEIVHPTVGLKILESSYKQYGELTTQLDRADLGTGTGKLWEKIPKVYKAPVAHINTVGISKKVVGKASLAVAGTAGSAITFSLTLDHGGGSEHQRRADS